jgi:hypothetical protein
MRGGFGFRAASMPVIVLATDSDLRDPDCASCTGYNTVPGGCPLDAGETEVAEALLDLGAVFVGVDTSGVPTAQMTQLADDTNSDADIDGDGVADPLVYRLNASSPTDADDFSAYLNLALSQVVPNVHYDRVSVQAEDDPYGFVTGIDPAEIDDVWPATTPSLTFTLQFTGTVTATAEDQWFVVTLDVVGDGTVLDTHDLVIRVPGTG